MQHNLLALFITDPKQVQYIDTVKEQFNNDDIVIVTDNNFTIPNYAMISLFYLKFLRCDIVFFSIDDYLNNRDYFTINQVCLAVTEQELANSNIDIAKLHLNKVIKL